MPPPCNHTEPSLACPLCRLWRSRGDYRRLWGDPDAPPEPTPERGPCVHLGRIALWQERPDNLREWRSCDKGHGIICPCMVCKTCPDHQSEPELNFPEPTMSADLNAISWPVRFDENNLSPGKPGRRFNSSIIDWKGEYLLAYRDGWAGSEIHVIRLDRSFSPVGESVRLDLMHWTDANYGREDPRLFLFRGRLHVAYVGVVGGDQIWHTNVLYARIGDDLRAEEVFSPQYPQRNLWEKNWSFFEHGGDLYCSYSIAPHRVLRIEGERATLAHTTATPAPWSGGEARGGASPVRVGDVFYSFFHASVEQNGHRVYHMGLLTFEAKPPFRVLSITPQPILWADQGSRPDDQYASVIFPCGAVMRDDHWVVSCGIHDRTTSLEVFYKGHLDAKLVRFAPPEGIRFRENTDDPGVWSWVYAQDEYRLRDIDLAGQTVVDIGGHIGSFALAAASRGAASVHCYEPGPENRELLLHNCGRESAAILVRSAAVWSHDGRLRYQPGGDVFHSAHGMVFPDADGGIEAVGIDRAIEEAAERTGRVRLLKLDCEGAEAVILPAAKRLDLVDWVVGEYHTPFIRGLVESVLAGQGFRVEILPGGNPETGLFFAKRSELH